MLIVIASVAIPLPCAFGQAIGRQSPIASAQLPGYDVASIRLNNSSSGNVDIDSGRGNYVATNVSLLNLVEDAYGIRRALIFGGPKWIGSARFDLRAKLVDPDLAALKRLSPEEEHGLLRPVLTDRFQLKVHTETKVLPVYELVVAKGGPKFRASTDLSGKDEGTHIQNAVLTAHAISLASLADSLSNQVHQTVIDRTGLAGRYDLELRWTSPYAPDSSPESSLSSIFTALQEQLGLRLRSAKGPVETLVIDHVEMPSEN